MQEAGPVSDVIVHVILCQVEHVLTQDLGLLGIGDAQLSSKVDCLQLHNLLLVAQKVGVAD